VPFRSKGKKINLVPPSLGNICPNQRKFPGVKFVKLVFLENTGNPETPFSKIIPRDSYGKKIGQYKPVKVAQEFE